MLSLRVWVGFYCVCAHLSAFCVLPMCQLVSLFGRVSVQGYEICTHSCMLCVYQVPVCVYRIPGNTRDFSRTREVHTTNRMAFFALLLRKSARKFVGGRVQYHTRYLLYGIYLSECGSLSTCMSVRACLSASCVCTCALICLCRRVHVPCACLCFVCHGLWLCIGGG